MAILSIDAAREPPPLRSPAIVLVNPKFSANVAKIYRLAACFGVAQIWHTGNRIGPDMGRRRRTRLPPEERMRGHGKVDLLKWQRDDESLFDYLREGEPTIVGVEFEEDSVSLLSYQHEVDRCAYVFGPEDGSLSVDDRSSCDTIVRIPTAHCLNLAMAVTVVLWDRTSKLWRDHGVPPPGP